jgi:hypothetical protein
VQGTIKDNKYLCDPPGWSSTKSSSQNFKFSDLISFISRSLFG